MIELRKITWDNFEACINLSITDEQEKYDFVPSNTYSLAQAYIALLYGENSPIPRTYAIYNDETMIGFTWFYYDAVTNEYDTKPCYVILRFMIDQHYQNKGFGKHAMEKIVAYIKTYPYGEAEAIYLSYDHRNTAAIKLYQSLGYKETGEIHEDEVVTKLLL